MIDYAAAGAGGRHGAPPAARRRDLVPGLLGAGDRQQPGRADLPGHPGRRRLAGHRPEGLDQPRPVRPPLRPAHPHRHRRTRPTRGITALFVDMDSPGITVRPIETMHGAPSSARSSSTTWRCPSTAPWARRARGGRWPWTCLPFERSTALWHRAAYLQRRLQDLVEIVPDDALDPASVGERRSCSPPSGPARGRPSTAWPPASGSDRRPRSTRCWWPRPNRRSSTSPPKPAWLPTVLLGDDPASARWRSEYPLLAGGDHLRRDRGDPAQHHRPAAARPRERPLMEAAELELFDRTLRRATDAHTGAALDAALAELGWHEALAARPTVGGAPALRAPGWGGSHELRARRRDRRCTRHRRRLGCRGGAPGRSAVRSRPPARTPIVSWCTVWQRPDSCTQRRPSWRQPVRKARTLPWWTAAVKTAELTLPADIRAWIRGSAWWRSPARRRLWGQPRRFDPARGAQP